MARRALAALLASPPQALAPFVPARRALQPDPLSRTVGDLRRLQVAVLGGIHNSACRHLHCVFYTRMADMLMELNHARACADGSHFEKMGELKTVKLPIVDDFMTTPISTQDAVDLF